MRLQYIIPLDDNVIYLYLMQAFGHFKGFFSIKDEVVEVTEYGAE